MPRDENDKFQSGYASPVDGVETWRRAERIRLISKRQAIGSRRRRQWTLIFSACSRLHWEKFGMQ